jgi:hypothetical protein
MMVDIERNLHINLEELAVKKVGTKEHLIIIDDTGSPHALQMAPT